MLLSHSTFGSSLGWLDSLGSVEEVTEDESLDGSRTEETVLARLVLVGVDGEVLSEGGDETFSDGRGGEGLREMGEGRMGGEFGGGFGGTSERAGSEDEVGSVDLLLGFSELNTLG